MGHSNFPVAAQFARISRELQQRQPIEEPTLDRVVRLAVETVDGADACGISIRQPDRTIETPASTSDLVQQLDDLQYRLDEGPCIDAVWILDTYSIEDMSAEQRWPRWAPAAAGLGIGSSLSVRIETDAKVLGGLNLYSRTTGAFDITDVAIASIFARHAANALAVSERAEDMQAALRSRQTIGVAQGMLMQRYGLTLDQSFEVLRRYSQEENIKVRDLAEQLVRTGNITDSIDETISLPSRAPHGPHLI